MSLTTAPRKRPRRRRSTTIASVPLVCLFHRRWTVPILAQLHRDRGAKFIALINRLGVSRPALRQTLDDAISATWVQRNPGYGHPLRPEYVLTAAGQSMGPACERLMNRIERLEVEIVAGHKWSMPLLQTLGRDQCRFGALREQLGSITDRALTLAIKDLIDAGLIGRRVTEDFPPTTLYRSTRRARSLQPDLDRLARTLSDHR